MIVILFLFLCMLSSGQNRLDSRAAISAELTSIIMNQKLRFGFCHRFSGNWSAEGSASIHMPEAAKASAEELEHEGLISGKKDEKRESLSPEFRLGIRFWPKLFSEGPYLGVYCVHSLKEGTDMSMDFGYTIKLCRFFGVSAGYEIKLLESRTKGIFVTDGITISFNYIF